MPQVGRWSKGAGRGALSLLRRTAPLLVGVFGWGQSTQTAVWPELVVILSPGFDQMARFGEPEDIAALVAFIAGPEGRFLQGAMIDMDGGATKTL